jgi:hypothetical protein
MRTMPNVVAFIVVGGMLLFPSQSAQACLGRKACSICAARGCWSGYGSSGYGYGVGYGYTYPYGYGYCSTGGAAGRQSDRTTRPESTQADEGLRATLADLNATLRQINDRLGDVESHLRRNDERLYRLEREAFPPAGAPTPGTPAPGTQTPGRPAMVLPPPLAPTRNATLSAR